MPGIPLTPLFSVTIGLDNSWQVTIFKKWTNTLSLKQNIHPVHKWLPIQNLLYAFKLAQLTSFKSKITLNYHLQNEGS